MNTLKKIILKCFACINIVKSAANKSYISKIYSVEFHVKNFRISH